jgi:hypothetical protein
MKKLSLLIIISLLSGFAVKAQCFKTNNIDISLGAGLGVYATTTNDTSAKKDGAAALIIPISIEYSFSKAFSAGLFFERNGFIRGTDSATTSTPKDSLNSATSLNYGIKGTYRFVCKEKNALYLFFKLGASDFKYTDIKSSNYAKSQGLYYQLGLGWKHYFGKNIGMFIDAAYAGYSYNKIYDKTGIVMRTNGNSEDFKIKLSGANLNLGLSIKF